MAHPSEWVQKTVGSKGQPLVGNACPRQHVRRIVSTRRNPRLITAPLIDSGGLDKPNSGELATRKHCAATALSYEINLTTSSNFTLSGGACRRFNRGRKTAGMAGVVSI